MAQDRAKRTTSFTAFATLIAAVAASSIAVVLSVSGTSESEAVVVGGSCGIALAIWAVVARLERRATERTASLLPPMPVTGTTGDAQAHRLLTRASTEFRSPLTGIYGMSQMIEHDRNAPAHVKQFASVISAAAVDLTRMVEDVLTCAQLDAGDLSLFTEELDAAEQTRIAVKPFEHGLCGMRVSCSPAPIRADRAALRQILRNLVSNAVRHGGDEVEVVAGVHGDTYRWMIRDNGPGLPADFEATTRTGLDGIAGDEQGGLGLGLAMARRLARSLGGDLRYRRTNGTTEFSFVLPLVRAQTQAPLAPSPAPRNPGFQLAGLVRP